MDQHYIRRYDELMSKVIFIAANAFELSEIRNGYYERVYGEYVNYMHKYGGTLYSLDDKVLLGAKLNIIKKFINSIHFSIWLIINIKKNNYVIIMTYPTVMRVVYILPLFYLLRLFGFIKIIITLHDLNLEQKEAVTGRKVNFIRFILTRSIDYLYLNLLSDIITVVSPSYRNYLNRIYNINIEKIKISYNSSFPELFISSDPPKIFTVLYAGSLMIGKGIKDLIDIISKLRDEGFKIRLTLLGEKKMLIPNKNWIEIYNVPFTEIPKFYAKMSIGIISFPKRLHYVYTLPIKLFDYMAAAKPIISLDLKETASIINKYNCGIVTNNYEEMSKAIKHLYQNRNLIMKLGNNGRKAVEKEFNWTKRVKQLKDIIDSISHDCIETFTHISGGL